MEYQYQIEYDSGWENAYPDFYAMHVPACMGGGCDGCYRPAADRGQKWLDAVIADGATAARVMSGGNIINEVEG